MKTTTKTAAKKASKKNPHDIANEQLDAAMTESDRAYWAEAAKWDPAN